MDKCNLFCPEPYLLSLCAEGNKGDSRVGRYHLRALGSSPSHSSDQRTSTTGALFCDNRFLQTATDGRSIIRRKKNNRSKKREEVADGNEGG